MHTQFYSRFFFLEVNLYISDNRKSDVTSSVCVAWGVTYVAFKHNGESKSLTVTRTAPLGVQ